MGYCKDCRYVSVSAGLLRNKYVCKNYEVELFEKRNSHSNEPIEVVVKENGSCNYFSPAPTSEKIGYHVDKGEGGCFLTSACVEYLGKEDDCEELTILRRFRDTYMKNVPGGEDMIKEYYLIAPQIVKKINESAQRDKYYDYIYKKITKSVEFINDNANESALLEYTSMVNDLRTELGVA